MVRTEQPVKHEDRRQHQTPKSDEDNNPRPKAKGSRSKNADAVDDATKRRCVSTACVACRKRKSKCDGNKPCAACSQVYGTQCVYDPNSDHRRKGVYRKDFDSLKTKNSTLQTLVQAILNYPEDEVMDLVHQIRSAESLDKVAESVAAKDKNNENQKSEDEVEPDVAKDEATHKFEAQLSSKMGKVRLDGSMRYIGGTSNLIYFHGEAEGEGVAATEAFEQHEDPITSWTTVTSDPDLITDLLNHYFTWHYTFFTCVSKSLFYRHFRYGKPPEGNRRQVEYCSPLLVNAMCALGCHFSSRAGTRDDPKDSGTAGDHFFREARRLIAEENELEQLRLTTVQALALMSVREAGCGREARGWQYSGMAFRMACDLGLNYNGTAQPELKPSVASDEEQDARQITFWGCFIIDKCWSNYLGRIPIFQTSSNVTVTKPEVWPSEEAEVWCPYSESGFSEGNAQPSRVRALSLQISALCDISSDLITYFYHPSQADKPSSKHTEIKRLSEIHQRLEDWKRNLPKEFEPKEGLLSSALVMHMFFQLLYIHLFRPFLKYSSKTSPLPSHVSPRRVCTQAAAMISKLLRLYKRSFGLRQICNIVVYIVHSACSIHLLNLPDKTAARDLTHGIKHLEEMAEGWPCARRTLTALSVQATDWNVELPTEVSTLLQRTDSKFRRKGSQAQPAESFKRIVHGHNDDTHMNEQVMDMSRDFENFTNADAQDGLYAAAATSNGSGYTGSSTSSSTASGFMPQATGVIFGDVPRTSAMNSHVPTTMMPFSTSGLELPVSATSNAPMSSSMRPHQLPSSDMFGGVEALLREGQDWWVKDQSQIASGFGNWGNSGMLPTLEQGGNSGSWDQQQRSDQEQQIDRNGSQETPSPPTQYHTSLVSSQAPVTMPLEMPNAMNEGRNRNGIPEHQLRATEFAGLNSYIAGHYENERAWYQ